jgi:hypothetical protein
LSVQRGVVDILVVDTVFFSARDTNLHFEKAVHGSQSLQVLDTNFDVLGLGFLGQVQHVGAEEGFAVCLEVFFVGSDHAVEPRKQLLGTVVRVDWGEFEGQSFRGQSKSKLPLLTHDGNSVRAGHRADEMSSSNSSQNRSLLLSVGKAFAGHELSTAVRELDNDGGLDVSRRFENGIDGRARGAVEGRDGKVVLLSVIEDGAARDCHEDVSNGESKIVEQTYRTSFPVITPAGTPKAASAVAAPAADLCIFGRCGSIEALFAERNGLASP